MSTPVPSRSFTLRDLLIAVAVIALGFALLVPLLRKSRESAHRTDCMNNVKQMGLGIQNFHDIRQEIAPSYLTDDHSARAIPNGFITWPLLIVPFMESSNIYDLIDVGVPLDQPPPRPPSDHSIVVTTTIETYLCPTRRAAPASTLGPTPVSVGDYANVSLADAVVGNVDRGVPRRWDAAMLPTRAFNASTTANTVELNGFEPNTMGGREFRSMTNFASITDGLTYTVFIGEKAVHQGRLGHADVLPGQQDGSFYFGRGGNPADLVAPGAMAFWSRRLAPDRAGERLIEEKPRLEDPNNRFGGWHPGVTLFLMGDGSAKAVSNDTATLVLQRLGCRNDGHKEELP